MRFEPPSSLDDYLDYTNPLRRKAKGKHSEQELAAIRTTARMLKGEPEAKPEYPHTWIDRLAGVSPDADLPWWQKSLTWLPGRAAPAIGKGIGEIASDAHYLLATHEDPDMWKRQIDPVTGLPEKKFGVELMLRKVLPMVKTDWDMFFNNPTFKAGKFLDEMREQYGEDSIQAMIASENLARQWPIYAARAYGLDSEQYKQASTVMARRNEQWAQSSFSMAMMNDFLSKYGSWDKFGDTLYNRPDQILLDIADIGMIEFTDLARILRRATPDNVGEVIDEARGYIATHYTSPTPYQEILKSGVLKPKRDVTRKGGVMIREEIEVGDDQYVFFSIGDKYSPSYWRTHGFAYQVDDLIENYGALVGPELLFDYGKIRDEIVRSNIPPAQRMDAYKQRIAALQAEKRLSGDEARKHIEEVIERGDEIEIDELEILVPKDVLVEDAAMHGRTEDVQRFEPRGPISQLHEGGGGTGEGRRAFRGQPNRYFWNSEVLDEASFTERLQRDWQITAEEAQQVIELYDTSVNISDPVLQQFLQTGDSDQLLSNLGRRTEQWLGDRAEHEIGLAAPWRERTGIEMPDVVTSLDPEWRQRAGTSSPGAQMGESSLDLTPDDMDDIDEFLQEVQGLLDDDDLIRESGKPYRIGEREWTDAELDALEQDLEEGSILSADDLQSIEGYDQLERRLDRRWAIGRNATREERRGGRRQTTEPRRKHSMIQNRWDEAISDDFYRNSEITPSRPVTKNFDEKTIRTAIKMIEYSRSRRDAGYGDLLPPRADREYRFKVYTSPDSSPGLFTLYTHGNQLRMHQRQSP